jgi:hypothetical protein
MANISTRIAENASNGAQRGFAGGSLEGVAWMMTVLVEGVACNAKVIILTSSTSDKLSLGKHWGR